MRSIIDTNILLYAANSDLPQHGQAQRYLHECLSGKVSCGLTWGIIYEFLRVATHPKVFKKPLHITQALEFITAILQTDSVEILSPGENHLELLTRTAKELNFAAGNLLHDIHTAVIMREYGLREIVTADTDFLQFNFLKVVNPVLGAAIV